ncbi:MAG: hypothetical protein KKD11_04670 [Candidatus Omnitrophica bacterium]|nr:hypothetical protein [Candidatus Omnitrophota bacterium]
MQYIELKENLKDFTVFSLADIKAIDSVFHRRRLNEWQDKGYIKKIIRGYYVFSDIEINENALFEIANRIYSPSYISFEMALSYYGLIPEAVYGVTSAATRRTYRFKTFAGEFLYRSVKPGLFFGYNIAGDDKKRFKIACPEKAILDYFYMHPAIKEASDFIDLRINRKVFMEVVSLKKLKILLRKFRQKSLNKRIRNFMEFIRHA